MTADDSAKGQPQPVGGTPAAEASPGASAPAAETKKAASSAINVVFFLFLAIALVVAPLNGRMEEITEASFEAAKSAVTLAISLVGIMALWLGLVRILEAGGLMYAIARTLRPLMTRLFPDVPPEHPAMGAMILNISANMLGLGNAATPFGIKAMTELDKLNPFKGTATNAMCLFLAINTSGVALMPLGVIGVRAAAGSNDPAAIWPPTLIATTASTVVGVLIALFLARRDREYRVTFAAARATLEPDTAQPKEGVAETESPFGHLLLAPSAATAMKQYLPIAAAALLLVILAVLGSGLFERFAPSSAAAGIAGTAIAYLAGSAYMRRTFRSAHAVWRECGWIMLFFFLLAFTISLLSAADQSEFLRVEFVSNWLMPGLMLLILFYGCVRGVKMYEAVTEGAVQGFEIAIRIIPFLVAILVAVGMFRASGAMELMSMVLAPVTGFFGMPPEVLPMALIRPLSGSGAFAIMSEMVQQAPDSYDAFIASTMMGSTETTFYVLAVYFGAVGVVRIRHALVAALIADATGVLAACAAAPLFYTP